MSARSYTLLEQRFEHAAGTVVYEYHGCDYGCVSDDERDTGRCHTAVTLDPMGKHPFFTVPVDGLREGAS